MSENLATVCPKCRGWTRVIDGNWLVPHFANWRTTHKVCPGSSTRTDGEVVTVAEMIARAKRKK